MFLQGSGATYDTRQKRISMGLENCTRFTHLLHLVKAINPGLDELRQVQEFYPKHTIFQDCNNTDIDDQQTAWEKHTKMLPSKMAYRSHKLDIRDCNE